ncbi:MAG: hypothetical protein KGO05_15010, partial [Chloroflexota bacterium]|nr:hypothetical protein [Chloroflexota bacterium]
MNSRLRVLLAALADTQAYRRALRLPMVLLVSALVFVVAIYAGAAYALWLYWPTLLLAGATLTDGPFEIWLLLLNLFNLTSIPLSFARLENHFSTEPYTLALALRRALAAGDPELADLAPATAEANAEGEDAQPLFASAPTETPPDTPSGADTLVVAIPAPLITSLIGPISLGIVAALLLLTAGGGLLFATFALNPPFDQIFTTRAGQVYLVTVCGSSLFLALLFLRQTLRLRRRRRLQQQGMAVALDDMGLSFHHPLWRKRPRQIAWADARGLGRYTYMDDYIRKRRVYLLESEGETLLWEEPPTERYAAQRDHEAILARQRASWRLVAEITRRTRLPIRDISATLVAIGGDGSSASSSSSITFLAEAYSAALQARDVELAKDVELATALWRARNPHRRRLPRALRKLAAAA